MLLKQITLDRIRAGEIDVVYRRWKKPTVKTGGSLRTAIGMLEIRAVERVALRSVTVQDAIRAGFRSKAALLAELADREGDLYRVEVGLGGADPLITLREADDLSGDDVEELVVKLARLDARAEAPWTRSYLELIDAKPSVRAADIAASIGEEREVLKVEVRKLKRLGLTISESPGYRLSPRGSRLLSILRERRV